MRIERTPETATSTTYRLLMTRVGSGDQQAWSELVALVYDELRGRARKLVPHGRSALEPTDLVHEVLNEIGIRLDELQFEGLTHFVAYASRMLRNRLIDIRRRELSDKRGGGKIEILPESTIAEVAKSLDVAELIDLHDALEWLRAERPLHWRIAESRLAGLTMQEIADAENMPLKTLEPKWAFARGLLRERLAVN